MSGNITSYVEETPEPFTRRAVSEADLLVFSALMYFEFERFGRFSQPGASTPLGTLGEHGSLEAYVEHDCNPTGMLPLARAVVASPRFAPVCLERFECIVSEERVVQYAAACFPVRDDTVVVAFRGTDAHWVGWQEDLDMAWKPATPGQEEAQRYLAEAAQAYPGCTLLVCGHSKGGACAEYAAVFAAEQVAARVGRVCSFDGPSLARVGTSICPEFKAYDAALEQRYATLPFTVTRYVFPAMIGLMLETRDPHMFTFTRTLDTQLAHNVCAVEVREGKLATRIPSPAEIRSGQRITRFARKLTLEERQWLPAFLVGALRDAGVSPQLDIVSPAPEVKRAIMDAYQRLDRKEKRRARHVLRCAMTS